MRTLAELIRWRARRPPDLEAVWYDGNSRTYRQLDESTSRLAGALVSDLGIKTGDRVAILDKNCAAYLELILALDKAGAVAAPPCEVGELVYQGESLMTGYWARKKETDEVIRDGWLRTGDAGYVDKDGFFFIKDRLKDMIVSGIENIFPLLGGLHHQYVRI